MTNEDSNVWKKQDGNIITLGIKKESADAVKEFMFVKLPEVGKNLKKGDVFVSLEALKWSGHLETPVEGEVVEINEEIYDEPELLNKDPINNWICKIKIN